MSADELSPTSDPALVAAWQRFVAYDSNATVRMRVDRRVRLAVVYIAALAVVLVGVYVASLIWQLTVYEGTAPLYEDERPGLYILIFVVALLLLITAIYAFLRSQTSANAEYYAYRLAESLIQREIYLYRLGVGRYLEMNPRDRQRLLNQSLKAIDDRVQKMGLQPVTEALLNESLLAQAIARSGDWGLAERPFTAMSVSDFVDYRVLPVQNLYARRARSAARYFILHQLISGAFLVMGILLLFLEQQVYFLVCLFGALAVQQQLQIIDDSARRLFYESTAQQLQEALNDWNLVRTELRLGDEPGDPQATPREAEQQKQRQLSSRRTMSEFVERVEDTLQFATEMWVLSSFFRSANSGMNQQSVVTDLMQNGIALLNRSTQVSPIRYAKQAIFISYRRADSAEIVGRIWDRLSAYFGQETIFRDVQTILGGEDFVQRILTTVERCSVVLVIIGTDWENITDTETGERRLLNPEDFVRREIATALKRPEALVVPVLVRGAKVPDRDELPEDLKELTFRNAMLARSDPDFDGDIKRIITAIESYVRQA